MKTVRTKARLAPAWRWIAAAALVAAGSARAAPEETYALDPVHSRIGFAIAHLGISKVRGAFTNFNGQVTLTKGGADVVGAEVVIQTASVDTSSAMRDRYILGKDFFDAKAFPEIRFKADKAEKRGDTWFLVGTFTMHGVARTVELPLALAGPIQDPWGNPRVGLSIATVLDRRQYGVGSDKLSDKLVGRDVTIEINAEAAVRKAE